ncbi:hypothetical protein QE418_003376 [Microbacterium testaceum]|uniref:hypothetical protein n=1 Tax=Microbacterium TaxID=33882 RepID=UPI002784F24C|nr:MULTISPECIES: hypothetical protein [Microbacterium]MDQ1113928.1 hypothetical protein [Microbacterium testaceum]MDR6098965.1 hypothetical protein [Microbacterium sp. SORGH_AS_0454]
MYSIDGIPLDNRALGWRFMRSSNPYAEMSQEIEEVRSPTQDGDAGGSAGRMVAPILPFTMVTPKVNLSALDSLFASASVLADGSGRTAGVKFVSRSVEHWGEAEPKVRVTYTLRIPAAFWRGPEVTPAATAISNATTVVRCLGDSALPGSGGLNAPVGDAIIRVKGQATALRVADTGGSWFTYDGPIAATEWLRFHAASGRAFLTTADTWEGGTEVSGRIDYGGPRGRFEITPMFPSPLDRKVREARLTVGTTIRVGAALQVRARPAFMV